ncbi:lanosterol synthase 1 [Actinidia rufa]|uniref:Lanosterol synthase 1 n=1 Tax=Actinidia rufa TaxID=165716 RepID=A0A7J0DW35_9ERIC|nr:lanosterol synthase 1 [Actinidia rufa]
MWKLVVSQGNDPWLKSTNNHMGREFWEFDPNLGTSEERAQVEQIRDEFHSNRFQLKHSSDLLMRLQFAKENPCEMKLAQVKVGSEEEITKEGVETTLRRALRFYSTLQADDGHWPGDYGGPLFLLPGLVISLSVMGTLSTILPQEHQREIRRYLYNHQNIDGGWGFHIEGGSTMLCTALNYVTLRLLGESMGDGDGAIKKARKWILDHGGATHIPSWGKLWLSVLGVYDWSGNNPLPPEIWLLPYLLPIHPVEGEIVTFELRHHAALSPNFQEDLYYPHPTIQDILWGSLHKIAEPLLMQWPFSRLRKKALNTVMQHIHYEDENTQYICLGPVSKVLNMVCCWVEDPNSEAIRLHLPRITDYLWVAEDGMKMKGYNGSQLWDVSFAVKAILATNLADEYGSTLKKAHESGLTAQVILAPGTVTCPRVDGLSPPKIIVGQYQIALQKAALLLSQMPSAIAGEAIAANQLYDAVNFLLSLQNSSGGFASYELTRSYAWMEMINPAETFGDVIIDYQYVECTSAAIQAIRSFMNYYPGYRRKEIEACVVKALEFIEGTQLPDGSWFVSSFLKILFRF